MCVLGMVGVIVCVCARDGGCHSVVGALRTVQSYICYMHFYGNKKLLTWPQIFLSF